MPSRKMCQEQQNGSESGMEERERSRKRSSGEGVELAEWVTHKRSQLRPQRFIVVIYLPSLLLIFTPHTVYKVLHSTLTSSLSIPSSFYLLLSLFPSLSVCLSVHQSGMLTAYLFIHFLIYWCLSDPTQTDKRTDRQTVRQTSWNTETESVHCQSSRCCAD